MPRLPCEYAGTLRFGALIGESACDLGELATLAAGDTQHCASISTFLHVRPARDHVEAEVEKLGKP